VVAAVQLFARHANPKIRVQRYNQLLGAFVKLRKATISFAMSARLSDRPTDRPAVHMEQLGSHWTDFHEI